MPKCVKIQKKIKGVCVGDLSTKITLCTRTISAPALSSVDYGETFTEVKTLYALVDTTRGLQTFDGVNITNPYSHLFYIRYDASVTFEYWIKYNSEYFRIIDVENLNEENRFLLMRCTKRGSTAINANLS